MEIIGLNIVDQWMWDGFTPISMIGTLVMLAVVLFYLIMYKLMNPEPFRLPESDNLDFSQYTLSIEETYTKEKKVSFFTKVVLVVMSIILIYTPLEKLLIPEPFYFF